MMSTNAENGHPWGVPKDTPGVSHQHGCCSPQKKWYQKKVWWFVGASFLGGAISLLLRPLQPFAYAFWEYVGMVSWVMGIGLLVGGVIDSFVPQEIISHILARPKKRTIFYAVGLGALASACSHGILALSMELHKKGASGPAVISFLLASPWSNLPITILLFGLFGWKAIVIILSALLIAINMGLAFQKLDQLGWIERNKNTVPVSSPRKRGPAGRKVKTFGDDSVPARYRFSPSQLRADTAAVARGTLELAEMVLGWVMLGVVLASLARSYIPAHFFHAYLGPHFLGLALTLAFATVIEVCSEGTAPIAFEIYRQTGAFGNSFVFLMAGVITDWTELALVGANLGKKTVFWMLLLGIPQILLLGWIFNQF